MPLDRHIPAVTALHAALDARTAQFARSAGLSCPTGCGACCSNPALDASVLDVLPLAQRLITQGIAEKTIAEMAQRRNAHCYFFHESAPGQGHCTQYEARPSLCRLFGYCGRLDKYGKKEAVPCRVLKAPFESQMETQPALRALLPTFNDARRTLEDIDPGLAVVLPLPQALTTALEKLLLETSLQNV